MTLPVVSVTFPYDLTNVANGNLPSGLLVSVHTKGQLHHNAARAYKALVAAAANAGFNLTFTYGGMYRTYLSQVTLFNSRYEPCSAFTYYMTPSARRKYWPGHGYYRMRNFGTASAPKWPAMAAVPGTSNHGWALAIDLASGTDPSNATSLSSGALNWLLAHAAEYGFSWETQSEPWHVRYVTGDAIPQAVLNYENPGWKPLPVAVRPTLVKGIKDEGYGIVYFHTKYVQRVLIKALNAWIVEDGVYDGLTVDYVKEFQKRANLTVDGVVGQQTWPVIDIWATYFGVK